MKRKFQVIDVKDIEVSIRFDESGDEFISLTDIARFKNPAEPKIVVANWMRNRSSIEFLGLWEKLHNPDFKGIEFDTFLYEAGSNAFTLTPRKWIENTNAKGITSKAGNRGGTFAHRDIALEFASWVSAEFKLYLLLEFQRLKEQEQKQFGWNLKRNLAAINYRIHTDAIKEHLIPKELTKSQISMVYANEADVLNMVLFGTTAKQWREINPKLKGNMRDYADIAQLVCLSNLESLNAEMIESGLPQTERLKRLNNSAIRQMKSLAASNSVRKLTK